ncbi:ankyrin and armadillo repeat-containing protein isoform X1 [Peromyscus eremicus]|uniref:ankyrin and armadillo repeat-containing protein isoform X1 n=1 Tax=Peromyscus eremicus TaxID=42410 RepID=UPI0027DC4257|nr:ankyrin and armadillo repeat-containing protein isoform X1 [Peromyscus eremicus]XP_059134002.1 ankyrin and armadillo repeat-containing protein isoform X1 [Peromyscus eremicus]XP_059134003.1 ankyrin and armadillo repeat-containing protein isoform X1 [Peromyscus eremicus]XP_059134004.1 ankyrin and armadillo repeat-containing protein isoform X1 [Peromyscus eremicus]
MLRLSKKGIVRIDQVQDEETYLENLAVQRNASAFFEKYDRSEVQELLTTALVSWLSAKEDVRSQLDIPCGLMSQINNVGFSTAILLTPVDPTAHLDYREVHQILRELAVGIYCLNQIPSISLEANYDQSSSCQLPPAYYDTRIGQILIYIDYMLKALWHGIYMPKEKRTRFSELWRTIMDIDPDGKPQTTKDIFSEFSSAGLVDITNDPDFDGIYDEDMNEDPTYDPNSPEEKAVFMKYAENIMLKLTFSTTQVQQHENIFIFETAYWLTNAIKYNQDYLDICTYQRLQQRLYLQKKVIQKHFEKKKEIRRGIGYLKLICFLIPFLLSLKKRMKVPYLNSLLPPFSDDKVKTERELPPFIYGRDFKCQNFDYKEHQYFHVHGGIEFDISTNPVESALDDFKKNVEKIQECAANTFAEDSGYKEFYSVPVMEFYGKSYYVIYFDLEIFYQQLYKTQWWGAINEIINNLRLKRLPLTEAQLHEQFKKKFGFKKAIKCKSIPFGMKSAVERGLSAVFHTFSRKTSSSTINVSDEAGYAIFHHAALHNRVSIICQLCNANFNVNQRRFVMFSQESSKADMKKERNGPTPLHLAAQACSLEATVCLLCFKADHTLTEKRGWMPIHFAAFYDNICIIIALCRKDPSLLEAEATAENQCTPLLLAATSGALDTIQYLFSLGANWRKTDAKGNNIIHLSVLTFHTEVLKYIIELNIPELPVWKTLVEMLQCESFKRRMMAVMSLEVVCLANDQYWKCILDAGTIPALINLLKCPKIKLQCKTVGLLSNISTHVSVVHALVEAGGIPALINLLASDEPELHSRCAVILYDIAKCENKDVISKYNGIPALINLLSLNIESVLVNVMNCIRVLCIGNESNQRAMRDHNGIQYLIRFLSSDSDALKAVSSATIAEVGRDNKDVQDAIAMQGAIPPLVALFKGKQLSVQVKGAMAVESLASYNPFIQKAFLERKLTKDLLKLLKAFQIDVKEQGAVALWALAGQTLKQQKYMAEQIGYNFIINMLLSPSAKMQYVGGEAVIALSKDSRIHQNQICEGNGIAPLVRLLRINKIAEGTLLSVIRAVGSICIGVAHTSNAMSQRFVVEENAFPVLIQLLRSHPSTNIKVEVAFSLACIVLGNELLQKELQEKEGFEYSDVLYLLHSKEKDICLRAGYALTLFAFNNRFQQYLILESGMLTLSIFEPFLRSKVETEKAMAAFQIIVLAKVIIDVDHITLSARGVTILVDSLYSVHIPTIVLAGNLIASLAHSRAGIPAAFLTLGTVQRLCYHLYSGREEVRTACSCALGYLTYNAHAFRILLKECRNKPNQFLRIMNNISRDAKINPAFLKEFQMQQNVGLPSLSLEKNGGPSIIPVFKKGKEHRRKTRPKIQPRDSLTLIPPVTNFMGLFKTTKQATVSHNIFSFSSGISSDIINVSRPRIVCLNNLGKREQKANTEPTES